VIATSGVSKVARELGVSVCYLQHLLRRDLGVTYTRLVRRHRVELVRQTLLARPELSIAEVASLFDYDPPQLYRHFRSELGVSPSQVRRRRDEERM
jgi:AraC-like DNA-binding protein